MAEPAKLTIRRGFARPSVEGMAPFRSAPTGWVVDAMGRRGALPHWIRPISKETRFVGPALTVRTRPLDNLAPYAALKFASPGDVLVIAADGSESGSILGDILLGMARNAGVVAAVTDGLVRDVRGIDEVGLPTFARGLSPNSPFKDGPGEIGFPVTIGGVRVEPGDLLVGDVDGVAVVPCADIDRVGKELQAIAEKEAAMEAAVAGGARCPGWLDGLLAGDGVRFVD